MVESSILGAGGGAPETGPAPGFLPPGLSPEPVWQCRAALALGIGPSPCQEWGWLRSRRRSGAHGTLRGLPCPLPVPGARPHLTIPLIRGGTTGAASTPAHGWLLTKTTGGKSPFFPPPADKWQCCAAFLSGYSFPFCLWLSELCFPPPQALTFLPARLSAGWGGGGVPGLAACWIAASTAWFFLC